MKNFGKVIFSTGLALSLGTFLIASPLFAETAKTDKPMTGTEAPAAADKPAADKPATDKKPMKKKAAAKSTAPKKKAAKKDDGAMKTTEEKKPEATAPK